MLSATRRWTNEGIGPTLMASSCARLLSLRVGVLRACLTTVVMRLRAVIVLRTIVAELGGVLVSMIGRRW